MVTEALKEIAHQTGTLIMSVDRKIITCSGDLSGDSAQQTAETIFSMLQDSLNVLKCGDTNSIASTNDPLTKLTVTFPTYNYIVTLDQSQIYVVKVDTQSEE